MPGYSSVVALRSGFPGERISVLPRPRVVSALEQPVTSRLLVTDCGYFPSAADHLRTRPTGCAETILILCVDGYGWCELPGGSHAVHPGHALVIPAGTPHRYGSAEDSPWTVWWMHLRGDDVGALVEANGASAQNPVVTVTDLPRAVALVEEALRGMERDDSMATLQLAAGAGWHLLALLSTAASGLSPGRPDAVQLTMEYLQQRFTQKVSVAELAEHAGLSPSHLSAIFRKAVGCGPHEYQTRLRMMKSRQLLDTTEIPVSVIARNVGYGDPLYFSRQFRSVHGMTPSEHRARAKG
ncbi:AraC family transcriptional regulator [Kineosporia mesophila]|nr:helix-turn-helix domain-containing protein [Kineosporia mesophila]MCD5354758.1 AraC family transcriptional regulator [Kineosporia mesophila]